MTGIESAALRPAISRGRQNPKAVCGDNSSPSVPGEGGVAQMLPHLILAEVGDLAANLQLRNLCVWDGRAQACRESCDLN